MSAVAVALMVLLVLLIGLGAILLGAKALGAEADKVRGTRGAGKRD